MYGSKSMYNTSTNCMATVAFLHIIICEIERNNIRMLILSWICMVYIAHLHVIDQDSWLMTLMNRVSKTPGGNEPGNLNIGILFGHVDRSVMLFRI